MTTRAISPRSRIVPSDVDVDVDRVHDVAVVGSGPAGYTAAIYTARSGFDTLIIEGATPGGALATAGHVENYPGFVRPVCGPSLARAMREQAQLFGAEFQAGEAKGFDLAGPVKTVSLADRVCHARALILAMGAVSHPLDVPGEHRLLGHGVSTSAKHDGAQYIGCDVAVVGGGEAAVEETLFLAPLAHRVTLIHHRPRLRAPATTAARLNTHPNIVTLTSTKVLAVQGETDLSGLRVRDIHTAAEYDIAVAAVFVAAGQTPRTDLLQGLLTLDARGHIRTDPTSSATSAAGVFAAGDVIDRRYRQAVTAAASGCIAALDARQWLTAPPLG